MEEFELENKIRDAFEAGRQRGIYEIVELNYTIDFDASNPPPNIDEYYEGIK